MRCCCLIKAATARDEGKSQQLGVGKAKPVDARPACPTGQGRGAGVCGGSGWQRRGGDEAPQSLSRSLSVRCGTRHSRKYGCRSAVAARSALNERQRVDCMGARGQAVAGSRGQIRKGSLGGCDQQAAEQGGRVPTIKGLSRRATVARLQDAAKRPLAALESACGRRGRASQPCARERLGFWAGGRIYSEGVGPFGASATAVARDRCLGV